MAEGRAPLRAAAEPVPRGEAGLLRARRPEPDLVPDAARVRRVASTGDLPREAAVPGPGERSAVAAAGARDWTVDLADFAVDSRTILQQVVPGHLASPDAPSLFIESAAVRVPSFAAHDGLRRWQARRCVRLRRVRAGTGAREGGALVPLLRSLGDCARVRAMPPLSLGERKGAVSGSPARGR